MSLSKHEQAELQRLLAKAKGRAVRPCDSPFEDEYDGFCVYDPSTGLFHNPETGETRDVWTEESVVGAMSDASKRRDATDGSDDDHQSKRVMKPTAKSSAMPLQDPRPTSLSQGYMAPQMMVPYPGGSSTHGVVMSNLPELPPGVENVTMWSRTVISFGRFQGRDMTYFDLVTSQDEKSRDYVKWCRSRSNSASGQLQDLCKFMAHFFHGKQDEDAGVVIPGTNQRRVLKD